MPSVRDLRDRIRSLRNTQQITKAMKQVAAAKIRRAEMAQKQARPYADAMSEMLHDLIASVGSVDHPFMKPGRAGAPRGLVVMTADKGLAGAFNANVLREAGRISRSDAPPYWYPVGKKAMKAAPRLAQAAQAAGGGEADASLVASLIWKGLPFSDGSKLQNARELAAAVTDDFVTGKISEIVLISSRLVTRMVQRPETRTLVPIVAEQTSVASGPRALLEFAPSPEAVLSRLLPKYLEFTLFSAMLETDAAFFAAQLVAMTNATDNAGKLIDELTIAMNKARQAAITKEMLEIVGGAEALVS